MATQTASQTSSAPTALTLRRALQTDSLICMLSGVILVPAASAFSTWIGLDSSGMVLALGLFLIVYGATMFWQANRPTLNKNFARAIIAVNVVWFIGSIILLVTDPLTLTTAGRWFVLLAADGVACLAIWQFVGLRRTQ